MMEGKLNKAKDNLMEAAKLDVQNNPWYYIYWACYYSLQRNKTETFNNIQSAIDLGFKDIQWLKEENSLEYIQKEDEFALLLQKMNEI
jgi:hypothetical protein